MDVLHMPFGDSNPDSFVVVVAAVVAPTETNSYKQLLATVVDVPVVVVTVVVVVLVVFVVAHLLNEFVQSAASNQLFDNVQQRCYQLYTFDQAMFQHNFVND